MKKIISTILLVAICFTLCACSDVKQEVYDTLKAGYDEVSSKYDELKSKVEKYSTVIDALEKEDYDSAVEAVNAMRPAPEVTEVEITMDNLWDYFEIAENRNEETDAQGNLYRLNLDYRLLLKGEYDLADGEKYPTDVAVGYEYDHITNLYFTPCTIDFETFTCDRSIANQMKSHESETVHIKGLDNVYLYSLIVHCPTDQSSNIMGQIDSAENFNVLNASGTLYLVNK